MTAELFNPTTNRTVIGDVIQRGINRITLVVTDKHGSQSIKGFNETKWIIRVFKEEK